MQTTDSVLSELSRASLRLRNDPYETIGWPEALDPEAWHFTPELISIHGTEDFEALAEDRKRNVALLEAISFFSMNIHGERRLVQGVAERLHRGRPAELDAYLHHFLREECNHMAVFGRFCEQYAGRVYADRQIAFPHDYADGEEDALFFAKILIFEEIVDAYNRRMAADERLAPIVRAIHSYHHEDEKRHLAFGRSIVRDLFDAHRPTWSRKVLTGVRAHLSGYLRAVWRELHNPSVYADTGLASPYELLERSWENPISRERRREVSARCVGFLLEADVLDEEPVL